jgi:hypothetical protein
MRSLYLLLAVAGLVLPYYFYVSFLAENGLDLPLLLDQFFASDISTFFAVDLIITALAFCVFLYQEAQKLEMQHWWLFVVATLLVGPSFALPLFPYFRKGRLEVVST